MFTRVEIDAWKERMKTIRSRLSRSQSLTKNEFESLKVELDSIEQLVQKAEQS